MPLIPGSLILFKIRLLGRSKCLPTSVRKNMNFRWNLFEHIGKVSSLRVTGLHHSPGCWESYSDLQSIVRRTTINLSRYQVDKFNMGSCSDDDLYPCVRPDLKSFTPSQLLDIESTVFMMTYIDVKC